MRDQVVPSPSLDSRFDKKVASFSLEDEGGLEVREEGGGEGGSCVSLLLCAEGEGEVEKLERSKSHCLIDQGLRCLVYALLDRMRRERWGEDGVNGGGGGTHLFSLMACSFPLLYSS